MLLRSFFTRNAAAAAAAFVLGTVGILTGIGLVRGALVTDFVGVDITYLLTGPGNPDCADVSDRQIDVSWQDRDSNEAGFLVERRGPVVNGTSTAVFQVPALAGSGGQVTFSDNRVVPDAQYNYIIRSFLGPAQSPPTSTACSTQSIPTQPSDVLAEGGPDTTMVVSWQDNSLNEEGFYLWRYDSSDPESLDPSGRIVNYGQTNDTQSYDGDGLTSNTPYCYSVVAYNEEGPGATPPPGAERACGRTWSEQPIVTSFTVDDPVAPRPVFRWTFTDVDPSFPGSPEQTAARLQVCAGPFTGDTDGFDCTAENQRWDSGKVPMSALSLAYLENYGQGAVEHVLDFGPDKFYYARLRLWDDRDTRSNWTSLTQQSNFRLYYPPGATLLQFGDASSLTLLPPSTFDAGHGGEVRLQGNGTVRGQLTGSLEVVSARLRAAQAVRSGTLQWRVRVADSEGVYGIWQPIAADGSQVVTFDPPGSNLEWDVTASAGSTQGVVGSAAFTVDDNDPPEVESCQVTPPNGGSGDTFTYRVTVSDHNDTWDNLEVRWDYDDGGFDLTDGEEWAPYRVPPDSYTHVIVPERFYIPRVQARDQYLAVSQVADCTLITVGDATPAWLQTQDADVYSRGTISSRVPEADFGSNATYLVQASGAIDGFSTLGLTQCYASEEDSTCPPSRVTVPSYRSIPLPPPGGATGQLATILGSVDLVGITSGRYGPVLPLAGATVDLVDALFSRPPVPDVGGCVQDSGRCVLNGTIAYVPGNAVINDAVTFGNALPSANSGAGLIVVEGDLYINASIVYSRDLVQGSLQRLASVAWLVGGNVFIDPSVWATDGTGTCQSDVSNFGSDACGPGVAGTFYLYNPEAGIFFTGTDRSEPEDKPLKVSGVVVAQRFALQRNRNSETVPAELFQYDGRVFANPPPGLRDFAKALPRWRPLAPLP